MEVFQKDHFVCFAVQDEFILRQIFIKTVNVGLKTMLVIWNLFVDLREPVI